MNRRGETDTGCLAAAIIIAVILLLPVLERLVGAVERRNELLGRPPAVTAPRKDR